MDQIEQIEDLVEWVWNNPKLCSRNKNFYLFRGDVGKRALRTYRLLRSLKRDILSSKQVAISGGQDQTTVCVRLEAVHGSRQVVLSARLFGLLQSDPQLRQSLRWPDQSNPSGCGTT